MTSVISKVKLFLQMFDYFSLSVVKWASGIESGWTIPDLPKSVGTRLHHCRTVLEYDFLPAQIMSQKPLVQGRSRRAGASMIVHAFEPHFASNLGLLLMVSNTHWYVNLIYAYRSVYYRLTLSFLRRHAEGLGEDCMEDKPYCDVAMDEVIPAVKTLIRAVRWVLLLVASS